MVKRKESPATVYQLKVTLKGVNPPIWRRIQVPSDITLSRLHQILQVVVGWEDCHLHCFVIDGVDYGQRDRDFDGPKMIDESRVRLFRVVTRDKQKFRYDYDFGDDWQHDIVLEKVVPSELGNAYPICLAGKRHAPPEDCGGIWGYGHFLEVIRNPDDEEHADMLEWAGESFDADYFDRDEVNEALKRIRI